MIFQKIARLLKSEINGNSWHVGDLLPSEAELAVRYNVSRNTLRKALSLLEGEGIIHRKHGSGTYIQKKNFVAHIDHMNSFSEIAHKSGKEAGSQIMKFEVQDASPTIATELNLFAEKVVAVVLPVNAAMVVTLQYSVGRRLNPANIRALMTAGTLCFVIGLVGFIFSGNSLLLWGMSAAVFTVGEIIYAPGEYMLIDHIAPPGMKASYFSAQSLGWLGAAINPLVSGIVLTSLPPFSLFIILALVIVVAWVLMLKGIRARPWGQPALC